MTPIETDCRTVRSWLDAGEDFLFVDCREPDEHAIVRIEEAALIPMSEFAERATELEPYRDKRIVISCHHGGRSLRVAMWLRNQGFMQAISMSGGIDRWAQEIDTSLPRY